MTPHQKVLTALEQRAARYLNSRTCEDLEDERLLDEAIDETGTLLHASKRDGERSRVVVEEQLIKEIRGVSNICWRSMVCHQVGRARGLRS